MSSENLREIRELFIMATYYSNQYFKENIVGKEKTHNTDLIKMLGLLDVVIQLKIPNPTAPDYNRYVAMKAISYNMRTQVNHTVNREYTEKALALLDPIKLTPEGFDAYLRSVYDISHCLEQQPYQQIEVYLNDAMTAIDEFEKTGKERLSDEEIFGLEPTVLRAGPQWFTEQRQRFSDPLFKYYALVKNEKMMEKFVIPAIQGILRKETAVLKALLNAQNFKFEKFITLIGDHMEYLIKTRHFEQVNHLLSFLMFHLVKNGRFAESVAETNEINCAKALASYWCAKWADEVLRYTYLMVTMHEDSDVLTNPIRTEMVRFEEYVEPGVEIYENLFPVDAIESGRKWQKVIKNGKTWCQRAIDYIGKTGKTAKTDFCKEEDATNLMKSLLEWKTKQTFE